jgi:tellurite resistance protein
MEDIATLRKLSDLGMDDLSYKVLPLLPLVQVAWADGEIQANEKQLILDLAETRFQIGEEGRLLLQNWLRYRPTAEYVAQGREALVAVAGGAEPSQLGDDVLNDVVVLSRAVAKAAGGLFGIGAVSRSESDALEDIARMLNVAPGTPLARASAGLAPSLDAPARNRVTITFSSTVTLDLAASGGVVEPSPELGSGRFPVDRQGLTLGTDPAADLRVENDPRVGPLHCRFIERSRKFYVTDLDSEGGTWVNGERIAERRLLGGEAVRAGDVVVYFKLFRKIPKQLV